MAAGIFEYRDADPVPYAVMLGLQGQVPVHVWRLTDVKELDMVHWLRRRTVALTHVAEVPYSKRMAIMLASYRHVIQQTFGEPEKADLQRRQTLPGMPVMPSELARKKMADIRCCPEFLRRHRQMCPINGGWLVVAQSLARWFCQVAN